MTEQWCSGNIDLGADALALCLPREKCEKLCEAGMAVETKNAVAAASC